MIFPNISMFYARGSVQSPIEERELGFTSIGWGHIPSDAEYFDCPVIEACTATDQEVGDRSAGGEFSFDVIDEHMTWLWFRDRDSFRMAWRLARAICKGRKLVGIASREVVDIHRVGGHPVQGLAAEASAHHIAEAA